MIKRTTRESITIGMDLGDRFTEAAVLDSSGDLVETRRLRTLPEAFESAFTEYVGGLVVMEAGSSSPWISRLMQARGFEVQVANARKVRAISASQTKNDRADAEMLARIARLDPRLLYPIKHRSQQGQADLALIRQRDVLVRSRSQHINALRGFSKTMGVRLPSCQAEAFARRCAGSLEEAPYPGFDAGLQVISSLQQQIRVLDRQIERRCAEDYPEAVKLTQIRGVGALTALCFVLTIEDPTRFPKSRSVGAFIGLTPRLRDSGDHSPQLGISKSGDALLRRLLVNCGHYILGPFGEDSDLRRFGLRLSERGGSAARKRAAISVARRLAVLMHHLWLTGANYEPLYRASRA